MDSFDTVRIHRDFHIKGVVVQFNGCAVDAGSIFGYGIGRGCHGFSRTEHEEHQDTENQCKDQENGCINHFLHM